MKFTMTIESENEAFDTEDKARRELRRILEAVARDLNDGYDRGVPIYDENGNSVGEWGFEFSFPEGYEVTRESMLDQKEYTMTLPVTQFVVNSFLRDRANGRAPHVQDAFPDLSPGEREFILTGILPEIWDREFAPPDDEEIAALEAAKDEA